MKTAPDVLLTAEDRQQLKTLTSSGVSPARVQTRARILLMAADRTSGRGRSRTSNKEIAALLHVHPRTVSRVRQRYVAEGLQAALYDQARAGRPLEITGDVEAKVVMLACSAPPDGRDRWTLQLLADRMVELAYIDHLSDVAVMKVLKKTNCAPGLSRVGRSRR
jgi:putative transposase